MPSFLKKLTALAYGFCLSAPLLAQSPILSFSSGYIATTSPVTGYNSKPAANSSSFNNCAASNFTYTFNKGTDNALKLLSIVTNGKNYFIANTSNAKVALRRVNNSNVNGNRTVVSFESILVSTAACPGSGRLDIRLPYQDTMEKFLNNNFINQGTDNIFTNAGNGDGNNNNIERVDIIFPSGLVSANPSDAGFAIFDRGTNNSHDGFRIAAITSLDANGDPALFGAVKSCAKGNGSNNGNWGHPSTANGNRSLATYVLRKDAGETRLSVSAAISNQEIGGVFFSFTDLGIAPNQKIYGYAVLATDGIANPSSSQLLNINDGAVYPTDTKEVAGGLDMMAVNAIFSTGGTPLARQLLLNGKEENNQAILSWQLDPIEPGAVVELERSEDGRAFFLVPTPVKLSDKGSHTEPLAAKTYFYRLRKGRPGGSYEFSNVVALKGEPPTISVAPTITGSRQSVKVLGLPDGNYRAFLLTLEGRQYPVTMLVQNGSAALQLPLPLSFRGLLLLYFIGENQQRFGPVRMFIK
ncbi:MAG: hypothetical protein ACXVBT_01340 [Flavisolibacter sp.]